MDKETEMAQRIAAVLSGSMRELERVGAKRYFDFSGALPGIRVWLTSQVRPSGTIDFGLWWVTGKVRTEHAIELLKMNYAGRNGPFFASVLEHSGEYFLCLKYLFTVPRKCGIEEAADAFVMDIIGTMLSLQLPSGVDSFAGG